ncbi:MAG: DUF368 domain-containing protein [Acutalibacteraceae bacterium]|nr:DUF368 domain-containing protein [Acutalibacteraceae bacterium]
MHSIGGFLMALADSVPGVSGGSIAFILGFYDEFISSLDALVTGSKDEKKNAIKFLIKLGIGWVIGMLLAILILTQVFESHIYAISSLFLGFIVFSIPIIIRDEKDTVKNKYYNIVFTVLGVALVVMLTMFNGGSTSGATSTGVGGYAYLFLSGMLAISAMILPGISGSTILLIMGVYMTVLDSVKEVMHFEFTEDPSCLITCFVFGMGVIIGILLFIKLVKLALAKARPAMMYFIIGLMLGSLYAIVQGPTTLDEPLQAMTFWGSFSLPTLSTGTFSVLFFLLGGAIIIGLQVLKAVIEKSNSKAKEKSE